jgi:hypothetical protein
VVKKPGVLEVTKFKLYKQSIEDKNSFDKPENS